MLFADLGRQIRFLFVFLIYLFLNKKETQKDFVTKSLFVYAPHFNVESIDGVTRVLHAVCYIIRNKIASLE